jgi:hypothetical protein
MAIQDLADSLYNVFIFEKSGGICIFSQEFNELPVRINPDLAAGFFSAIHLFSEEMTGQTIKFMELDKICFHFHGNDSVYFVLVTTTDADRGVVQAFFSSLQQRFETRFKDQMESGSFHDMAVFSSFATDVEEEIGKKGIFQSIFELSSDLISERYKAARMQLLSLKKALEDTHLKRHVLKKRMHALKEAKEANEHRKKKNEHAH